MTGRDRHPRRRADAEVAVDLDYEVLGGGNGMLGVTASGSAVTLR